jgi:hypothetical protein
MLELFKWMYSLSPAEAWLIFLLLGLAMAITPYFSLIVRIIRIYVSRETPKIIDFSWRIAPDYLIYENADKQYYYMSNKKVAYQGCPIILSWTVTGAYRIDINPDFTKLTENSLITVIKPDSNTYTLIAYTLKGRLEQKIVIPQELIKQLQTNHLGGSNPFQQPEKKIQVNKTHASRYLGKELITHSIFGTIQSKNRRINTANSRIEYNHLVTEMSVQVNSYIRKQKIIAGGKFQPSKYNSVINTNNNN